MSHVYLVTGGGGFLGTAIVRALHARGDTVRSFSRAAHPHLRALGVEHRQGDLCDAAAVAAACEGCDFVIHAAAKPPPWGQPAEYDAINIGGTEHVIAGCVAHGVPYLVYTSTPSVVVADGDVEGGDENMPYGTHFFGSDYARSKAVAEQAVLAAHGRPLADGSGKLDTIALRPHMIWGPEDPHFLPRFVAKKRAGQLKRIGRVDPLVDTTYIDNAAQAHLDAADRLLEGAPVGGRPYFITNDERIGLWTMLDKMLAAAGEGPVEGRVPAGVARVVAGLSEGIGRTLSLRSEPRITRYVVHQTTTAHWFDISAARTQLQYKPSVDIAEGLRRLRAWHADRC